MSVSNIEMNRFRTVVLQDIADLIESDKTGGIREEKFTEKVLEYLEEASETEGAVLCREIRENSIGNRIHKINGYALSEGYETIDLFVTVFNGADELGRLYSDEIKTAVNLSTRFLSNLVTGKMEGIEETAPVFDFAKKINTIINEIVRVNIYILSDMLIPVNPPEQSEIGDIKIHYHIRDIEYIYRIHNSGSGKQAILIDFVQKFNVPISCLPMPEKNDDYQSYLAIIPASILANIYHDYGARLLEQNVRTFLQFRGNINKGIRDTIIKEPHMFMAYNNGISATAESIKLTDDRKSIVSIKDFQIVNGGQTTASIFQTQRKYKNADINAVCVQVKLTVINDPLKKTEIISRISRFANTQNKVSEADLSSNHPFHIELEHLSRKIWAPANLVKSQTRWFYERARGQFTDELSQIDKSSQQKKWLRRNPKDQKFAKEDLSRFYASWEMTPWWVVRGRQKNFVEFMKIADDIHTNQVFFEDLIAKSIIFKSAERLYGAGSKAIGDLRYMVVPYSISYLRFITSNKINLFKIWKNQQISIELENLIYTLLLKIDQFMRDTSQLGLIGEWAKKEECWKKLKEYKIEIDITKINNDLQSDLEINNRYNDSLLDPTQKNEIEKKINNINSNKWIEIYQWGKTTKKFDIIELNTIWKIIQKIENNKRLTDKDYFTANSIFKIFESK
ncbi:AIPR family protein [Flavobacterium aestivum]|uniref:AIPR family protein n=1 Tax=Flavobacterium aestivum TaxID=3003257 RepID=UPI0024828068|nr:AIPR family protein [Flavobacterium aestivum]